MNRVAALIDVGRALGFDLPSGSGAHLGSLLKRHSAEAVVLVLWRMALMERDFDQPLEYVARMLKGGDASCSTERVATVTHATPSSSPPSSPPVSAGELSTRAEALYALTDPKGTVRWKVREANAALDAVRPGAEERGDAGAWAAAALKARGAERREQA